VILLVLVYPFYYIFWTYQLEKDVWDVLDRAQTSADAEYMYKLTSEAISSLENKKGLISGKSQSSGHCALIFKKPSNSLDYQYRIMLNIQERLNVTRTFDKSSVEYQTAIDDIRGTIREVPYLDCWIWHFK
jgi:hypothetical protein